MFTEEKVDEILAKLLQYIYLILPHVTFIHVILWRLKCTKHPHQRTVEGEYLEKNFRNSLQKNFFTSTTTCSNNTVCVHVQGQHFQHFL